MLPLAGFNMFEKYLEPNDRQNDRRHPNGPQLHIPGPTYHDMAHGLRSDTPVCARNWFWPVFSDMMMVCVKAKKPGPAERLWAPNKATFMVIGALRFVQKLFKNLKSFWKEITLDHYKLSAFACGALLVHHFSLLLSDISWKFSSWCGIADYHYFAKALCFG